MFSALQLQQILLGYIPNPQLELVLVMFVVPFIVNVSGASAGAGWAGLEIAVQPRGTVPRDWLGAALKCLGQGGGVCKEIYLVTNLVTATVSVPNSLPFSELLWG